MQPAFAAHWRRTAKSIAATARTTSKWSGAWRCAMATQTRDLIDAKCASKGRARKASPMEKRRTRSRGVRRCGECMSSCRRALRRRGAWRGAATTSALGSRWQRAPSARRRRPRSRQGGEVHGVARCESAGTSRPRRNLGVVGEPKKGRGDRGPPRFWVVLICRCTSCPCVKTLAQPVILHTWRKIRSRRGRTDTTKPESPSLPSPIIFPSCAQVL